MNRRHAAHLAGLLAVAVAVRYVLFPYVGVWGDFGFYTYDSYLINEGQMPFVDFIGRSPLFTFTFAAVIRWVPGDHALLLRTFVAGWWVVAGVPVYVIARHIHGHLAGLVAVAVLELSPFMLTYGFWANTQSLAAVLAVSGIAVLVVREDHVGYAAAGLGCGAAFLARRSVIVILAGVGLYICWLGWRDRDIQAVVTRSVAAIAAFVGALAVGYLGFARGDVGLAVALAETHAWGLVSSSGRGGFPLITEAHPPPFLNRLKQGRIPIFNAVCQLCGSWTARTFAKTTIVAAPILAPMGYYGRDIAARYFTDAHRDYLGGILLILVAYGLVRAAGAGFYLRVGVVVALLLVAVGIALGPRLDRTVLYDRRVALLLCILFGLTAGYLYRNRILHTYYFADFLPYLAVVVGIVIVEARDAVTERHVRALLVVGLALAVAFSMLAQFPLMNIVYNDNEAGWFTTASIQSYGDDLDGRVEAGTPILTGHPSYVASADEARLLFDRPRLQYWAKLWNDSEGGDDFYARLTASIRNGTAPYAVRAEMLDEVLQRNQTAARAFERHYCPVTDWETQHLYNRTGATLYRWTGGECPAPTDMNLRG